MKYIKLVIILLSVVVASCAGGGNAKFKEESIVASQGMPTEVDLRMKLRKTFECIRSAKPGERDVVWFSDLYFYEKELHKIDKDEIYGEEVRRDALISHGYTPPEKLEAY